MDVRVEDIVSLDKHAFQRFVVDLLRAELAGKAFVRSGERRFGVNDGGWDVEVNGEAFGLEGKIRVEVKGIRTGSAATLREYRARYPRGPVIFITAEDLGLDTVHAMEDADTRVFAAGQVASWARSHAHVAATYLDSLGAGVIPLSRLGIQSSMRELARFPTEEAAVSEALQALRDDKDVVLVAGWERDGDRLLRSIAAALAAGDPVRRQVLWVEPEAYLAATAVRGEVRLLLPLASGGRLQRIVTQSAARVVVVVRAEPDGVDPLASRNPIVVRIAAPTPSELKEWALRSASGRQIEDVEEAILQLANADLIASWLQAPSLLAPHTRMELGTEATEVAAWAAALGESSADGARLGEILQRPERTVRSLLKQAARFLDVGAVVVPRTPTLAFLLILAWFGSEPSAGTIDAHLGRLTEDERKRVLLAWSRCGFGTSPCAAVGCWLARQSPQRRAELTTDSPVLAVTSEAVFVEALHDVAGQLGGQVGRRRASVLVSHAPRWPATLQDAWRVLCGLAEASAGDWRELARLAARLVDPMAVGADDVARLFWAVEAAVSSTSSTARLGCRLAAVWLTGDVTSETATSRTVTVRFRTWRANRPDVQSAFTAAREVFEAVLGAASWEIRRWGWEALPTLGRSGHHPAPAPMLEEVRALLGVAASRLAVESGWPERAVAEAALVSCLRASWAAPIAGAVANHLSTDPLYLIFRATFYSTTLILDPKDVLQLASGGGAGMRGLVGGFSWHPQAQQDAVVDALVASGAGATSVLRVLTEGARLRSIPDLHSYGDPTALRAWARRAPEVFRPLLTSSWSALPAEMQGLLTAAAGGAVVGTLPGGERPAGVTTELQRFLSRPESVDEPLAAALLVTIRELADGRTRAPLMLRAATHPSVQVRESVWYWLLAAHHEAPLDPRDVRAVVEQLLAPPTGLALIGTVRRFLPEVLPTEEHQGVLDAAILAAIDAGQLRDAGTRELAEEIGPCLARLAILRPREWWTIHRTLARAGAASLDEETVAGLLRQDWPTDYDTLLLIDDLVATLPGSTTAELVHARLSADPARARLLLQAAAPHPSLVAATEAVLRQTPGQAGTTLVTTIGRGFGNRGFSRPGGAWLDPFEGDAPTSPDPVAAAYRARAEEVKGAVSRLLHLLADAIEGR